jgi:hypothetical protein
VEVSKNDLHPMKFLNLFKPHHQVGFQLLRWKSGQDAEVQVYGVPPVREVELSQRSAPLEAKGL